MIRMLLLTSLLAAAVPASAHTLDGFDDPATWTVVTSDQVGASLRVVQGRDEAGVVHRRRQHRAGIPG